MTLTTTTPPALRIGDVARLVGTTARTIRYYEEFGLLGEPHARPAGSHRLYSDAEVEHLREVMRLRELLGVSLDELKTLVEAEEARAALRAEIEAGVEDPGRLRELLIAGVGHLDRSGSAPGSRSRSTAPAREDAVAGPAPGLSVAASAA